MNLRFIRSFIVLSEEKSFTRASQRLNLAQPALSQQIQKLELELGFPLFCRDTRPLSLTEAGRHFAVEAVEIIEKFDLASKSAAAIFRKKNKTIRIGFTRSSMYSFLPGFIRSFTAQKPDVELILSEAIGEQQLDLIRHGLMDIGIARDIKYTTGFDFMRIIDESLRVIVPIGHPLSNRISCSIIDLSDYPFILFPNHPSAFFPKKIVNLCESAGFTPKLAYMVSEIQTAIGLVSAGLGLSVIAESAAVRATGVCSLPLTCRGPQILTTSLVAVYRDSQASPIVRETLSLIEDYMTQHRNVVSPTN